MASLHIHSPLLWTAGTILPPLCLAVVVSRFVIRQSQRLNFGPDDWLILPALVLVFAMAVTMLAGVAEHGLAYPTPPSAPGTQFTTESHPQLVSRKVFWASVVLQVAALMFIKLSCIFFYKRIFGKSSRLVIITIWTMAALVLVWGLGYWLAMVFACKTHFDWFWTAIENQLKCADLAKIQLSLSISDVIMDIMILLFPVPLILKLKMSSANKFAVLGIFALGGLAIAASITRLVIISQELNAQFASTADEDFVSTAGVYFMYIEASLALIAVCLPSLTGAFKLKRVKALVEGFSSVFSNLSGLSVRSGASKATSDRQQRLDSLRSDNVKRLRSNKSSGVDVDVEIDVYPERDRIMVMNDVEQTFEKH